MVFITKWRGVPRLYTHLPRSLLVCLSMRLSKRVLSTQTCSCHANPDTAFPVPETKIVYALNYGRPLWGRTAKIIVRLPDGQEKDYFLKAFSLGDIGKCMCEGEFESLKAMHTVSSSFVPEPHAWGRYQDDPETYFLLADFRYIGEQVRSGASLCHLYVGIFTQGTNHFTSSFRC